MWATVRNNLQGLCYCLKFWQKKRVQLPVNLWFWLTPNLGWMNCERSDMTPSTSSLSLCLSLTLFSSLRLLQHLRDQPDSGGGRTTHQREWEGTSDREVRLPTGILRLLLRGRFPDACRTRWGDGVLGLDERKTPRLLLAPSESCEDSTGDNTFSADLGQASLSWSKWTSLQCQNTWGVTHKTQESHQE